MMKEFEEQAQAAELPQPVDAAEWLVTSPPEPDQIVENALDVKDKLAIIGSSKMRKTFFLLQFLLSAAAGIDFLSWKVIKPRRVFAIQFEIQPNHYHRRVLNMAKALRITSDALGDRFHILNARGLGLSGAEGIEKIKKIVEPYHPEIISFDPLYKIADGTENAAEDMKAIMKSFDMLSEEVGAGIVYVHHDAKGFSGDRDVRDRGAGSNVLGRDYDACIALTPHAANPYGIVVETLLRNYPPMDPIAVSWNEHGLFYIDISLAPTKQTSATRKARDTLGLENYMPVARAILQASGPLKIKVFKDRLRRSAGLSYARLEAFIDWAMSGSEPRLDKIERRGRGLHETVIGITEQIRLLRDAGEKKE